MKGLYVVTIGDPTVVDGDWDSEGVVEKLLDCTAVRSYELPPVGGADAEALVDRDGKDKQLQPNRTVTELLGDRLRPGEYIAGPALLVGYEPASGACVDLNLLDLVRLGARLVRAERAALS